MTLIPIGDIQYGAIGFADRTFKDHLKYIADTYENPRYIGMGDYVDVASPSNRVALKMANLYDSTRQQLDDAAMRSVDEITNLLLPTQGRWLGMLSGHHYWQFSSGVTSDQQIAMNLSTRFLDRCALLELSIMRNDGKTRGKITIWAHHGSTGSASAAAAGLRKLSTLAAHFPDVDIFLMGHYHEAMSRTLSRLRWTGSRLISRPTICAITGAWMRSYVEGKLSYPEDRALNPLAIGGLVIEVNPSIDAYGNFVPKFNVSQLS